MGITIRHYIFEDGGTLKRVPRRIVDALPFGTDAIPEYAGTRQKHAEVLIENEDRRPVRILDVTGTYWDFDGDGKIDASLRDSTGEWIDFAFSSLSRKITDGPVVDLVPELRRRELHQRHRWTITKAELDLIAADIWPGIHGSPAPEIASVTGRAPRRPPLSYHAKHTLQEIEGDVDNIKLKIHRLNEHSLKGLEFEAERTGTFEDPHLWQGVATEARLQREILAAHRTGRGEWYAVVEATRIEDRIIARKVATAHVKCATRAEAIDAGRRLMVEKASWLGPDTSLEVAIYSAMEWQSEDH